MLSLYRNQPNRWKFPATLQGIVLFTLICLAAACPVSAQDRVPAQVDWGAAQHDLQRDKEAIRASNQKFKAGGALQSELDQTRLPVLVLNTGPVKGVPEFKQQAIAYVAAYQLPRAVLSIMGSATALALPSEALGGLLENAGGEYVFTGVQDEESDDVANLSFSRYGASYVLRLACESAEDKRCRKPGFLMSVAEGLANVGGHP
jgi:hypothetical protein